MLENPFSRGNSAPETEKNANEEPLRSEPRSLQADLEWCRNLAIASGGRYVGQTKVIAGVSYRTVVMP